MSSRFRKKVQAAFAAVDERVIEKRYAVRAAKGPARQSLDDRIIALHRQGYMSRQIASLLNMDLSEVNKQLRELPPVKVDRL